MGKDQDWVQSSISLVRVRRVVSYERGLRDVYVAYNFTFGGTQTGWIGEMSVPVTSTSGNSSAKSLMRCK